MLTSLACTTVATLTPLPDAPAWAPSVRYDGVSAGDRAGTGVSILGDIDGDGFEDVLVAASPAERYIVRGSAEPSDLVLSAADADWTGTFATSAGDADGDGATDLVLSLDGDAGLLLGHRDGRLPDPADAFVVGRFRWRTRSQAGDLDRDGFGDLLFADPDDGAGSGRVMLLSGSEDPATPEREVLTWLGSPGQHLGTALHPIGDVDGDGLGDLLLGGDVESFLFLGAPRLDGGTTADADAAYAAAARPAIGGELAGARDVDGDGRDDLLFGTEGFAHLVLGTAHPATTDLDDADARMSGCAWEDTAPNVSPAGDVDGDGLDDVLVACTRGEGAWLHGGVVYLVRGRPAFEDLILEDDADGRFEGPGDLRYAGTSLASGDVNGDGYGDVLVGEPSEDGPGGAWLFLGGPMTAMGPGSSRGAR